MSTAEHLHVVDRCLDPLSRDIQQIKAVDRSVRLVSSQARMPTGRTDAPSFDSLKPGVLGEPVVYVGNENHNVQVSGPKPITTPVAAFSRDTMDFYRRPPLSKTPEPLPYLIEQIEAVIRSYTEAQEMPGGEERDGERWGEFIGVGRLQGALTHFKQQTRR